MDKILTDRELGDQAVAASIIAAASLPEGTKAKVRAMVFGHLAGIVLAPTLAALSDTGVLGLFHTASEWVDFEYIVNRTGVSRGYLSVALRLLVARGWLRRRDEGRRSFALTDAGKVGITGALPLYIEAAGFIPSALRMDELLFGSPPPDLCSSFDRMVQRVREHWAKPGTPLEPNAGIRTQLDGLVVGPVMTALSQRGLLTGNGGPLQFASVPGQQTLRSVLGLLQAQGWIDQQGDEIRLTPGGSYAAQIATSYGVTISYLPLMNDLRLLLSGDPQLSRVDEQGSEVLVDRAMNVWGSGGAHKTYFKTVDEIVTKLFNRPIQEQPRGICDMGCGDGTFLAHLYSVIKNRTERGRMLDTNPLLVIGADYSKVARRVTRQTLKAAKIPASHVVHGDINCPGRLAADLEKLGHDIHDFFHVRSFLDHNRPYLRPAGYRRGTRIGQSTGAFAHRGEDIQPDEIEENLVQHFRRWAPYVGRFGLLLLELHTLPPELTAANLDRTPALAYDGTHGYSDQYLVEIPVFLSCAEEAGLAADLRFQAKFPPSELATVSINLFTERL